LKVGKTKSFEENTTQIPTLEAFIIVCVC